jgi:hypothetical protein
VESAPKSGLPASTAQSQPFVPSQQAADGGQKRSFFFNSKNGGQQVAQNEDCKYKLIFLKWTN